MRSPFVLDCSVTLAWYFDDEVTKLTAELLDRVAVDTAIVPTIWNLELTNVLIVAERKKRSTPEYAAEFIQRLSALPIEVIAEPAPTVIGSLLPLCREHRLTAYDAAYLDLALRHGRPLASLDTDLRAAARKVGVTLLGK